MASIAPNPAQSSEDSPPREHHRAPRSERVVCTACRQSKVRCVGSNQVPCSRCTRLGLECRRDTNFKRVCKSRKIAELEKQVERLTSAFNAGAGLSPGSIPTQVLINPKLASPQFTACSDASQAGNPAPIPKGSSSSTVTQFAPPSPSPAQARAVDDISTGIYSVYRVTEDVPPPWEGTREPANIPRSIHSAFLSTSEIDDLFQIYFSLYHPFLPFLDPTKSPDDYWLDGPVLFWAIVGVASRRYSDDIMLFTVLSEWVPKLIWSTISSPPYTVASAQAITLVSAWPFPSESMQNETITTLSAITISICMQLGLHRPMNATDFQKTKLNVDEKECRNRTAIWAAAILVSQGVESTMGMLPTTPFDTTIDLACQTGTIYTLPDNMRIKLMLQRYCYKVTQAVCKYSSMPQELQSHEGTRSFELPWQKEIDLLDKGLDSIERENCHRFTVHDRVHLAEARFYGSCMSFFDPSHSEHRKQGVLRAYNHAATMILVMMEADALCKFFSHGTAYHIRMFLIAIFTLVKVLRSSYSADIDLEAGKKMCNRATGFISRCSVANNDSAAKAAKIIAQVWHSKNTGVLHEPPYLFVKSRLAGSLLYDFLWTWRQEFGRSQEPYPGADKVALGVDHDVLMSQGFFEDASMVDLDFLNDPNWMESLVTPIV